jgi:1,4-alpha-glucan branching enzyme
MLFSFDDEGNPGAFESDDHQRQLPRLTNGHFPDAVWFAQGAARVVLQDPQLHQQTSLRVHLISQSRFRPGQLYLWDPVTGAHRRCDQRDLDDLGPYFDIELDPAEQCFFNFKFIRQVDDEFKAFEPDLANRWWVASDGPEIWVHSGTAGIAHAVPEKRRLTLNVRQPFDSPAKLRLWAENGDYETDVSGKAGADGWTTFETDLYAHLPYGCLVWNPGLPEESRWEHAEACRRGLVIAEDTLLWTLEGTNTLYSTRPTSNVRLDLSLGNTELSTLQGPLFAHVWVNRARGPLAEKAPVDSQGKVSLQTYPDVVTSIKFHDAQGRWEQIHRHAIHLSTSDSPAHRYVVLERPPLLEKAPSPHMVADPPFTIRRPGAYADGDWLRFVVHAPAAACVDLIGEWTNWLENPVPMQSTRDGTYWYASVRISQLIAGLGDGRTDYHGVKYQFRFNEHSRLQDPAAGWVERSSERAASRLVRTDRYVWHDHDWDRPGWESLIIYQIHPSRFTNRYPGDTPLRRVAREIEDSAGYFRELGVTAVQLMPVNEVGSENSWGYDPAYFYAVENDYCGDEGPDDFKRLVDTCHQHGLAVLLDVVFNHAGGIDNVLWHVARESFFDGDTRWGSMINFDHPQCLHFFAENLVYLAREFHIDGFRLDHTATIVHSAAWDDWSFHVRELGSGGGWEFLHALRRAVVHQVGSKCILTAEHLPNEWSLTNYGGSMDSQWCDDFHDRMVDACKRKFGMSQLADAFKLSQTACDDWYKVINYPESHDEVGNVRDRVAYIAGYGQGWRMSKVAAAATLMSRGIPLFFMGAESGEDRQFQFGSAKTLDLNEYLSNSDRGRIRAWWRELCWLRRDPSIQGPAALKVCLAEDQLLAFTRGSNDDFYVLLNFGGWSGHRELSSLQLPFGTYRELWNSTWPAFAIRAEHEGEHTNGGRQARLGRHNWLNVPDYGAIILQRV